MKIGTKLEWYDLFNYEDDKRLNVGDILYNNKTNEDFVVIDVDINDQDNYYSSIQLYPLSDFYNLKPNSLKINMKDLFKKSETINYSDFNDGDEEDHSYIYIDHIPIHKSTYIEYD